MEDELFRNTLAYPYAKGQTIQSFYRPVKLGREDYFSTLKQSYLVFKEKITTQAIF